MSFGIVECTKWLRIRDFNSIWFVEFNRYLDIHLIINVLRLKHVSTRPGNSQVASRVCLVQRILESEHTTFSGSAIYVRLTFHFTPDTDCTCTITPSMTVR